MRLSAFVNFLCPCILCIGNVSGFWVGKCQQYVLRESLVLRYVITLPYFDFDTVIYTELAEEGIFAGSPNVRLLVLKRTSNARWQTRYITSNCCLWHYVGVKNSPDSYTRISEKCFLLPSQLVVSDWFPRMQTCTYRIIMCKHDSYLLLVDIFPLTKICLMKNILVHM